VHLGNPGFAPIRLVQVPQSLREYCCLADAILSDQTMGLNLNADCSFTSFHGPFRARVID
jgi:hypothetical protein